MVSSHDPGVFCCEGIMLKTVYRVYCRIEEIFVGICFFGVVALTFTNALLRYVDKPITTSDDICLLLFAWAAFVGADVALRYSRLVGMDLVINKLPPKWKKTAQISVFLIMIAALLYLIPHGFQLAARNWDRILNSLPISYGWVTISFPSACILMILTSIVKLKKLLTNFKNDAYEVTKDNPDHVGEEYTGEDMKAVKI